MIREGLLVYDPDWHNYNWPELFESSWIQIDPEADSNNFKHARLVLNSRFENKSIIITTHDELNDEIAAEFMWCEHLDVYEITGLFVNDLYKNSGIAYFMAVGVRNWLISNYKVIVTPPGPNGRNPVFENFIKLKAIDWEDDTLPFLNDDDKYITYSEWKNSL